MSTSSDARNPVEALAEEFLDRKRRGEHPTLREYVERHPELAGEIRDLFPALLMMEDLGEDSGGTTGSLAADNGAALGTRLKRLGDYRLLREIGRGGMGVVYEAEQESLGRRVALKVLSAGLLVDPKQVRRFEREAKAAARLHHTNIVPVFGVGRQDGHHYFVMQFIAGLGLDVVLDDLRRLRRAKADPGPAAKPAPAANRVAGLTGVDVARSLISGRFDADGPPADGSVTEPLDDAEPAAANGLPADSGVSSAILPGSSEMSASSDPDRQFYRSVARIGIQVAEALEYANRQGILHRDVKPSNLLLDNHGNVWVADFGLAKTAEAGAVEKAGAGRAAGPGDDYRQSDRAGPCGAIRDGGGPGGGLAAVRGGPSDPCPADLAGGAAGALVPAEPGDRLLNGVGSPGTGGCCGALAALRSPADQARRDSCALRPGAETPCERAIRGPAGGRWVGGEL